MVNKKEVRSLAVKEFRAIKADDGSRTLSGIVAYNQRSVDLGGFTEVLAPGCFKGSLNSDILMLRDHQPTLLMGRTKSGTLTLTDTPDGLQFRCNLPNTAAGNDLAESINRGDLDATSFGFIVADDSWTQDSGATLRTVRTAELIELSPCSFAAYPNNSVSVRSCPKELRDKLAPELRAMGMADPDMDGDTGQNDTDGGDECSCDCQECQAGDCSTCSDADCQCPGCTCAESRSVEALRMKLKLAQLF